LLCALLSAPSLAEEAGEEPIVFLGDENLAPYEFLDGSEPRGASVDLLTTVGEGLERPVEVRLMKWSDAQERVLGGEGHALTLMSKSEERLELYDFSETTFDFTSSFFVRADLVAAFESAGLGGKRVGVTKGGFPHAFLEQHHPETELIFVETMLDGLNRVLLGEIDAVGSETWVGYHVIHEHGVSGIQALPRPFAVKVGGIAVPKGNEALVVELNRALRELKQSGRFAEILGKWSRHEVVLLERREIWFIAAAVTLVLTTIASFVAFLWVVNSKKVAQRRITELQAVNARLEQEIAERVRSENALAEGEERLRDFAESGSEWVWETGPDLRFTWVSDPFEQSAGTPAKNVLGKRRDEIGVFDPDDAERIAHLADLEAHRPFRAFEYAHKMQDGSLKHYLVSGKLAFSADGDFLGYRGTGSEITARKNMETRLRESERRFRAVMDNAPFVIALKDAEGRYLAVNRAWQDLTGVSSDEAVGKLPNEVYRSNSADEVAKLDRAVLEKGESIEVDDRAERTDGTFVDLRTISFPLMDDDGRIAGLGLIATDITERKQAETALALSEERFRKAFHAGPTLIAISDIDSGRFLDINDVAVNLMGYSRKEFLEHTTHELGTWVDPEDRKRLVELTRTQGGAKNFEARIRTKSGAILDCVISATTVELEGKAQLFTFVQDITEQKLLEQEVLRKERLAALGQLTGSVAHELRNPLGAVATSVSVIRRKCPGSDPDLEAALARADRGIKRCDTIITELLDFGRAKGLQPREMLLEAWFSSLLDELSIPEGVTVTRNLQADGIAARFDPDELRRAVINVVDNACQAMTEGLAGDSSTSSGDLTVTTRATAERIEIEIADSGPGIPEDMLTQILEPLYSTKAFGTGLGLPIVQRIMHAHGGGLEISSDEGRGAKVSLWLPLEPDAQRGRQA
jgi:PAS domain S-box-containing protein